MNLHTNIKLLCSYLLLTLFVGCRYLDEAPDSRTDVEIDSEQKIAELLTAAYPRASYFPFLEARTDNYGERTHGEHYRLNEAMYYWEDYDHEDLDTPLNYWRSCYEGIAHANKALELLKDYPKTERIKALYAEAFLLRAYLHFMLVNIWCEPYRGEGTAAPGIPYITKPEKQAIVEYSRGTVGEVYAKIEEDLKLGISLMTERTDKYYKQPKYHFNKRAAYAFASRFYLHKGDWSLVVQYADYVLGEAPGLMLRNWLGYERKYRFARPNLYLDYASKEEPSNLLITTTESRLARDLSHQLYGPTRERLQSIFDKQGFSGCEDAKSLNLSSLYLFNSSPSPVQQGVYMSKFDERSLLLDNSSTRPRDLYVSNVLLTTDEVMLNRIEAYTMLRQYDLATNDLILYMRAKYGLTIPCSSDLMFVNDSGLYESITPFYGLSVKQLAFIKTILDFRQKEFYQEGLRWLDIKRFYLPVTRNSRNSLYSPLTKEDPRKLVQIPQEAINRGLSANPRPTDPR